jgi:hypothetical protein
VYPWRIAISPKWSHNHTCSSRASLDTLSSNHRSSSSASTSSTSYSQSHYFAALNERVQQRHHQQQINRQHNNNNNNNRDADPFDPCSLVSIDDFTLDGIRRRVVDESSSLASMQQQDEQWPLGEPALSNCAFVAVQVTIFLFFIYFDGCCLCN